MGFVSPVLHHLTLQEIARLLPADELARCFVFSIVRNPWDRILSIYLFERKHARHYHPVGYEFPPLADYLDQLNPFYSLQQADFLAGPRQPDYVGRFEYLAEDFAHIANQIGLEGTQLPHLNHTSHEHYSSYYCDKTREKVARLFHKDIEQFGYSFEQR